MDSLIKATGYTESTGEEPTIENCTIETLDACNIIARKIQDFQIGEFCIVEGTVRRHVRKVADIIDIPLGIELRVRGDGDGGLYIYYPKAVIVWSILLRTTKIQKFKAQSGGTEINPHFKIWRSK